MSIFRQKTTYIICLKLKHDSIYSYYLGQVLRNQEKSRYYAKNKMKTVNGIGVDLFGEYFWENTLNEKYVKVLSKGQKFYLQVKFATVQKKKKKTPNKYLSLRNIDQN